MNDDELDAIRKRASKSHFDSEDDFTDWALQVSTDLRRVLRSLDYERELSRAIYRDLSNRRIQVANVDNLVARWSAVPLLRDVVRDLNEALDAAP